jgi:tRNA(fMet)-specific endonuclease VapC
MGYLLDTNILSDIMRNASGATARRADAEAATNLCTSVIVAAELRYGAARRQSSRLLVRLEELLSSITILPFEPPADDAYGRIRTQLERSGQPVGNMDLLIAAHALAGDHILVTDNEREFRRIDGLRVENWLRL